MATYFTTEESRAEKRARLPSRSAKKVLRKKCLFMSSETLDGSDFGSEMGLGREQRFVSADV
jgi:hypothetical protein